MSRFQKPLVILALGLVPFWLFIGSSSTTTVNGQVVSDSSFNLAGVILGLIGIGMAVSALRQGAQGDGLRLGLIAAAGVVCALQIAHSAGVISLPL